MIELLKKLYATTAALFGKLTALVLSFWKPIYFLGGLIVGFLTWIVAKITALVEVVTEFFATLDTQNIGDSLSFPTQLAQAASYGNTGLPISEMLSWSVALFTLFVVGTSIRIIKSWIPTVN